MNTNKLIGKKVKGFKFDDGIQKDFEYVSDMDSQIGKIGKIKNYRNSDNSYHVEFENDYWFYPAELIEQHLVEENPLDDLPIIGDGVLMEVSNQGITWICKNVFAKYNNSFVAWTDHESTISIQLWEHARPITPKTKITRKEFESKFEIID
jgi:hypothetical protein